MFAADLVPWSKMSTSNEWSFILNTNPSSQPGGWMRVLLLRLVRIEAEPLLTSVVAPLERVSCEHGRLPRGPRHGGRRLCALHPSSFLPRLRPYFDPHDDAENDVAVHDAVHVWFPKLLNGERHDKTTNGQVGGERTSPCAWKDPETCRCVVQRNRSRRI